MIHRTKCVERSVMNRRGCALSLAWQFVAQVNGKPVLEVVLPNGKAVPIEDSLPPEHIESLEAWLYPDQFLQIRMQDGMTQERMLIIIPLGLLPLD